MKKTKTPPKKLSPQESRVFNELRRTRTCTVMWLYRVARKLNSGPVRVIRVTDRQMQQHVGVVVQRLNKKRRRFVIRPGDQPRTYKLVRRR